MDDIYTVLYAENAYTIKCIVLLKKSVLFYVYQCCNCHHTCNTTNKKQIPKNVLFKHTYKCNNNHDDDDNNNNNSPIYTFSIYTQ